uniref:Vasoactive intestinal peptide receptor 2 n=1 Tax=Oryzias melastigma TaxID=30732 RepID=A0A3B3DGW4_ORYME
MEGDGVRIVDFGLVFVSYIKVLVIFCFELSLGHFSFRFVKIHSGLHFSLLPSVYLSVWFSVLPCQLNCSVLPLVWFSKGFYSLEYSLSTFSLSCATFLLTVPGCKGTWDSIACWEHTGLGETVTIPCPRALKTIFGRSGNISRNCTASGWSDVFPNISSVCESDTSQSKLVFYVVVQTLYTLGHSLSLIALITGSAILCLFRKLHCTRNYIHLNLFVSFILRAVAVLVKDDILFNRTSQCSNQSSLLGCKASLVFFQYFIMANFFWLLVEGLYLHTLLVVIFSENRHFIIYMFIGWGIPTVFVSAWVITRIYLEDTGIIRILVQKLRCPDVGGNDQSQYRRLAKSTLLLIPLFGIHYVVFVSFSESITEDYKIFFDLALGSFQGFVVAILYCFLNSEVQGELKRKWRSMCLNCNLTSPPHFSSTFTSRNGSEHMMQFHRNSRAQSILQSETTVL